MPAKVHLGHSPKEGSPDHELLESSAFGKGGAGSLQDYRQVDERTSLWSADLPEVWRGIAQILGPGSVQVIGSPMVWFLANLIGGDPCPVRAERLRSFHRVG